MGSFRRESDARARAPQLPSLLCYPLRSFPEARFFERVAQLVNAPSWVNLSARPPTPSRPPHPLVLQFLDLSGLAHDMQPAVWAARDLERLALEVPLFTFAT